MHDHQFGSDVQELEIWITFQRYSATPIGMAHPLNPFKPKIKYVKSTKNLQIKYSSEHPLYGDRFRFDEHKPNSVEGCQYLEKYLLEIRDTINKLGPSINKHCSFDWQKLVNLIDENKINLPKRDGEILELIEEEKRTRNDRSHSSIEPPPFHSPKLPSVIPVNRYPGGSNYIGHYNNGNQFWGQVVATFRPAPKQTTDSNQESTRENDQKVEKCWYALLHQFDKSGNHLGTEHKFIGTTADGETAVLNNAEKEMLSYIEALGKVSYGNIAIRLFCIEIDGATFGMIETSDEEFGDSVTMQPHGLYFHPPWNGEYDT